MPDVDRSYADADELLDDFRDCDIVLAFGVDVDAADGPRDATAGQVALWYDTSPEKAAQVQARNSAIDLGAALVERPDLLDLVESAVRAAREAQRRLD